MVLSFQHDVHHELYSMKKELYGLLNELCLILFLIYEASHCFDEPGFTGFHQRQ
jgi:hypothetical protein